MSSTLAGHQIRGPITVNSAGITTVRTMNVSSGMPSPTMTPSWVSTIRGKGAEHTEHSRQNDARAGDHRTGCRHRPHIQHDQHDGKNARDEHLPVARGRAPRSLAIQQTTRSAGVSMSSSRLLFGPCIGGASIRR